MNVVVFGETLYTASVLSVSAALGNPLPIVHADLEGDLRTVMALPAIKVDDRVMTGMYAVISALYAAAKVDEPAELFAAAAALEAAPIAAAAARPTTFFIPRETAARAVALVAAAASAPASLASALATVVEATDDVLAATLSAAGVSHDRYFSLQPVPSGQTYVTTPIYYVNGAPHIGHAYSTLLADVYARWSRLRGVPSFFQTGLDEHGMKVERSALARGLDPKAHCDSLVPAFLETFETFGLDFDRFIRTTDEDHIVAAQKMWTLLSNAGLIYKDVFSSWYNTSDEAYVTEKDTLPVLDDAGKEIGRVNADGAPLVWIEEENYILRLSALQEPLLAFYREHPDWIYPAFRQREMEAFVANGLRDVSVSRQKEKLSWGIPVPGDDAHVMYVWIDALTNYLTGAGWPAKPLEETRWPASVHVLGKDIIRFHAIIWPAMLIGAGLPLPASMIVHGWWTRDRKKIGKSLGNALDPKELVDEHGLDLVRWFLLRTADAGMDADYSDAQHKMVSQEIANNFGNLVSRAVAPKMNVFGEIPAPAQELTQADQELVSRIERLPGTVDHYLMGAPLNTRDAARAILAASSAVNTYVQTMAPWTLAKDTSDEAKARLSVVIHVICECTRILATVLIPFMPHAAQKALDWMGVPEELRNIENCVVGAGKGCKIQAPEQAVLFTIAK